MFLEVEKGGQDQDEDVKVNLIRFIADLRLIRLVYGTVA